MGSVLSRLFCSEGVENKGVDRGGKDVVIIKQEGHMGFRSYYLYYYYSEKERSPGASLCR